MQREQVLDFGSVKLRKEDDEEALYFLAGKKLYVVGAQSGEYPPLGWRRPGFLVGKPIEEVGPEDRPVRAAHLLNEMGGVWHQPIKVLDGLYYSIRDESGGVWELRQSTRFVSHFSHAQFEFQNDSLSVVRQDFVADREPALFSTLRIANRRATSARFTLRLCAQVNLMPAWFTGWSDGHDEVYFDGDVAVAYDALWPERWAVVFGSPLIPVEHLLARNEGKGTATLAYRFDLVPTGTIEVPFVFVAENQAGPKAALQRFHRLAGKQERHLHKKKSRYEQSVFGGVQFSSSDPEINDAYYCAKANLELLMTDLSPYLGRYFYAGIPEYAQLFGTDTCYAVPGAVASGLAEPIKDALSELLRLADQQCGRIPHEVTTNGRIFHPGNPQETPQFTIACWNYFCWTGDIGFLSRAYRLCEEGLLDYLVAHWDQDLDFYPDGQSMVERHGADEENIDTVCYFCRALFCLADMADALGYHESAKRYRDEYAGVLRVSLNHDFWLNDGGIFADSLRANHTPRADGYWTVVVPIETDLADPDKAERSLTTIEHQEGWLNEYGLVHTRGKELLVWTLPTGLLAKAAFAWGRSELGLRMLKDIALTIKQGMLGAFEELIPEGLSFIQLWSPALFLQGIFEGIFGLKPLVHRDTLEIFPKPPTTWQHAKLEGLRVGDRQVAIEWQAGAGGHVVRVRQKEGGGLRYILRWFEAAPLTATSTGASVSVTHERQGSRDVLRLDFALEPGNEIEIRLHAVPTAAPLTP